MCGKGASVNNKQASHIDLIVGCCNGVTRMLYCLLLTMLHVSLCFLNPLERLFLRCYSQSP